MADVDLRSDTFTKPTPQMRAAMAAAEVGDDVYGEDPTVNTLQDEVAALLGHEAGLFTPSGSMANQIGLQLLVPPGEELLTDANAHVLIYEMGAAAAYGGISSRTWPAVGGALDPAVVESLIRVPGGYDTNATRAIAVEQTHNRSGGTVIPLDTLRQLRELCDRYGLGLHCDGARLWNAHVATGVPLDVYGRLFDSVSVCLSKGLGAPVGSVLVSNRAAIARGRVIRKRLGGGMRQAGIIAAGGLYALRHHIPRLAEDHAHAARLATALAPAGVVDADAVRTNIVPLDLTKTALDAAGLAAAARDRGVLISEVTPRTARLVTHLDVDPAGVDRAAEVLYDLLR
ncbi:threonine aldolase family protein [Catenuloplanes indicus]|uniref:Threonine aldolase n=1 Tax=Catenuloplanes indicus TaxID=137267 RepID=A0AAE3VY48_9ACTN|nr:GntG family PLP-dependent aldolase [Catenuloplanes indicus]MDQ0365904.1 threonine aldolase [Catenuloplanes indicus]